MARQRFIWPTIWKDPVFGRLEAIEQLVFIGLFSIADDEGRLMADPAYLRSELFPYKDYTIEEVLVIRAAVIAKCENVYLYEVGGIEYIALLNWSEYQKPKYPTASKIPAPFPQSSPKPGGSLPYVAPNTGSTGREGLGREGKGKDSSPDGSAESGTVVDLKTEVREVYDHWRDKCGKSDARYNSVAPERAKKIRARLSDGFSIHDLKRAIDAVAADPWPDRKKHNDIPTIFRSREKVDEWLDRSTEGGSDEFAAYRF